mmetsp:Transcript_20960/g.47307  ORF Transcript_20960/g.47307 Transcript_20960/m.47307 type:complete len:319 (+) Transcript_20960:351-1307(+)
MSASWSNCLAMASSDMPAPPGIIPCMDLSMAGLDLSILNAALSWAGSIFNSADGSDGSSPAIGFAAPPAPPIGIPAPPPGEGIPGMAPPPPPPPAMARRISSICCGVMFFICAAAIFIISGLDAIISIWSAACLIWASLNEAICGLDRRTTSGSMFRSALACIRIRAGSMVDMASAPFWSMASETAAPPPPPAEADLADCCKPSAMSTLKSSSGITLSSTNSKSWALSSPAALYSASGTPLTLSTAWASATVKLSTSRSSGSKFSGLSSIALPPPSPSAPSTNTFCRPFAFGPFTTPDFPLYCAAALRPWSTTRVPIG